jgi:hypothetical protein
MSLSHLSLEMRHWPAVVVALLLQTFCGCGSADQTLEPGIMNDARHAHYHVHAADASHEHSHPDGLGGHTHTHSHIHSVDQSPM